MDGVDGWGEAGGSGTPLGAYGGVCDDGDEGAPLL